MFGRMLSLLLISLLCNFTGMNAVFADAKEQNEKRFAEKVKAGIIELGTGENVHVGVKLRDSTRLKGYVKEAGFESFLLSDPNSGSITTIHYPQVKNMKAYKVSTGQKIAVGLGITAAALFLILYIFQD